MATGIQTPPTALSFMVQQRAADIQNQRNIERQLASQQQAQQFRREEALRASERTFSSQSKLQDDQQAFLQEQQAREISRKEDALATTGTRAQSKQTFELEQNALDTLTQAFASMPGEAQQEFLETASQNPETVAFFERNGLPLTRLRASNPTTEEKFQRQLQLRKAGRTSKTKKAATEALENLDAQSAGATPSTPAAAKVPVPPRGTIDTIKQGDEKGVQVISDGEFVFRVSDLSPEQLAAITGQQ